MSVGLLAVRLLYRFYVRVHLSKWFTFSLFLVVSLLLSGRPLHLLPTPKYTKFQHATNFFILLLSVVSNFHYRDIQNTKFIDM